MTDEDKEDKQPTCAQVSHQEVWTLFENIWSNVCQTRWAELRLDECAMVKSWERFLIKCAWSWEHFSPFIECNSESSHDVMPEWIRCLTLRTVDAKRKRREFSYMCLFTLWANDWNAVYFDICFVFFPLHWPPEAFSPPVTFQHGRVQSVGLWPSHYAELSASGRSSAFAGRTGLFAQTVLHGLAAAPGLQQVSRPARIITIVWTNPLTPCSSACY